jgi:hypothetical protein
MTLIVRSIIPAAAFLFALNTDASGAAAGDASRTSLPAFVNENIGWMLLRGKYGGKDYQAPPPGSPGAAGPIGEDPDHPHLRQTDVRIGNANSPLFTPWAREQMLKTNAAILAGQAAIDPGASCWPAGVPTIITFALGVPLNFVPTRNNEVLMLYQYGPEVRRIYMDRPHSNNPKPSWYGESVGHVEGDTLVVDTIGLSDKSFVDLFGTPHTNALRVVERYRTIPDVEGKGGKTLQAVMTLDDPGAFTTPWSVVKLLGPTAQPYQEVICQEANADYFHQGLLPIPTAGTPDF